MQGHHMHCRVLLIDGTEVQELAIADQDHAMVLAEEYKSENFLDAVEEAMALAAKTNRWADYADLDKFGKALIVGTIIVVWVLR